MKYIILIFLIITSLSCSKSKDEDSSKSKSFYSMSRAGQLGGEFPNLRKLADWFTNPKNNEEAAISDFTYDPLLIDQLVRYIDNQIIRLDKMQAAFSEAENGNPVAFRSLIELESREFKDIYQAITLSDEEIATFSPPTGDMLAVFFVKLRQTGQNQNLLDNFADFQKVESEMLEMERVNLYNALAKEHFSDEYYTVIKDSELFYKNTDQMKETLNSLKTYFEGQVKGESSLFPTMESPMSMGGKTDTFLRWIYLYSNENVMGVFDQVDSPGDIPSVEEEEWLHEGNELTTVEDALDVSVALLVATGEVVLKYKDGYLSGRPEKKQEVRELQTLINSLGYAVDVDGYYGPDTKKHIAIIQSLLNMTVNGSEVSSALLEAMKKRATRESVPQVVTTVETPAVTPEVEQEGNDSVLDSVTELNATSTDTTTYPITDVEYIPPTARPKPVPRTSSTDPGAEVFPLKTSDIQSYKHPPRSYGARRGSRRHAGVDLEPKVGACGTKIYAMAKGVITGYRSFYRGSYQLIIKHENYIARYGEIKRGLPNGLGIGSEVEAGQHIGEMGKMRGISRCMLHLELFRGTHTGALSNSSIRPYERRVDNFNPTDKIDELYQEYLRTGN